MRRFCKITLILLVALALLVGGFSSVSSEVFIVALLGDANTDGQINAMDATRVLLFATEQIEFDPIQKKSGDVNADKEINAVDATLILLHAVGKKPIEQTGVSAPQPMLPEEESSADGEGGTVVSFDRLIWSDEFDGDSLDLTKWSYQHGTRDVAGNGPTFWGNNERQYYTEEAVSVADGFLTITARAWTEEDEEKYPDAPSSVRYTSARIRTIQDDGNVLFAETYGRFEARIKMPTGTDFWPAFWLMPVESVYGGWPKSGELDIMEARGQRPFEVGGALHTGSGWNNTKSSSKSYTLPDDGSITDFHTYAVEWEPGEVRWYVDDVHFFTSTADSWYNTGFGSDLAPFDQDFYILLNMAVCGNYVGQTGPAEEDLPGEMVVDYVRVYAYDVTPAE